MKKLITFSLIILSCLILYSTIDFSKNGHALEGILNSSSGELPFSKGERLMYDVKLNGVTIGSSILTFYGEKEINGKAAHHINFYTLIPSLKDSEDIYGDTESFLPMEVHRNLKKKLGFNETIIEVYDQENFRIDITSKSKLRSRKLSIERDAPVHNPILLSYFCRAKASFTKEDSFDITLSRTKFQVYYDGKKEIKTPLGKQLAHVFTSDPKKFTLYLSDDDRKTPLMIDSPGTLGYSLVIRSIE
ncbi:MAG: DUF3108 domain-containing protein [Candidatus Omnitrophota bacterium]